MKIRSVSLFYSPPSIILPWNPHWWPWCRITRIFHYYQNRKTKYTYSLLDFISIPCFHLSSGIPIHHCHHWNIYTTCTCCCCQSRCMLQGLWYLIQQAYFWPILEDNLWSSWVGSHQNYYPSTWSHSGNDPCYYTCEKPYLIWNMIFLQSQYHLHYGGSWSQLSSKTCWSTAQLIKYRPSEENACLEISLFQHQVITPWNKQCRDIHQ